MYHLGIQSKLFFSASVSGTVQNRHLHLLTINWHLPVPPRAAAGCPALHHYPVNPPAYVIGFTQIYTYADRIVPRWPWLNCGSSALSRHVPPHLYLNTPMFIVEGLIHRRTCRAGPKHHVATDCCKRSQYIHHCYRKQIEGWAIYCFLEMLFGSITMVLGEIKSWATVFVLLWFFFIPKSDECQPVFYFLQSPIVWADLAAQGL
jgi:hypothetical protein